MCICILYSIHTSPSTYVPTLWQILRDQAQQEMASTGSTQQRSVIDDAKTPAAPWSRVKPWSERGKLGGEAIEIGIF